MANNTQAPNNFKYHTQVGLILNIYQFSIFVLFLAVVLKILGSDTPSASLSSFIYPFFIAACLCYGISYTKSWVVLLIILKGYFGVFSIFSGFIIPYSSPPDLPASFGIVLFFMTRLSQIMLFVLFVYEVIIFSKQETQIYFKTNGIGII